jgi:membrane protein required for beta-lactamase induction
MNEFFASGHAVDVVLAVLAIEAIWLKLRSNSWVDILPALVPAVLMMVALRAALTGMAWPFISLPLILAFPVHVYDLRRRQMLSKHSINRT